MNILMKNCKMYTMSYMWSLKNKALKKQIYTLSKIDSNENICKKCDDLEKENKILKEEISDFNMEKDCFFKKNSSLN